MKNIFAKISGTFYKKIFSLLKALVLSRVAKVFFSLVILSAVVVNFNFASSASAVTQDYAGKKVVQTYQQIDIEPSKKITFEVQFKNIGTKTWQNDGPNFVALATINPEKRVSSFEDSSWETYYRPGRLIESSVKPGQVGRFKFILYAPAKEGKYVEKFQAVAKNLAWIEGAVLEITINVTKAVSKPEVKSSSNYPVRDKGYSAQLVQSKDKIELLAGEVLALQVGFKNTGTKTWQNSGKQFVSIYTVSPYYHNCVFADLSWFSPSQIKMTTKEVKPGEIGYFNFNLKAPAKLGNYKDVFRLAAEEYSWVGNSEFEININVVAKKTVAPPPQEDDANVTTENGITYKDLSYKAQKLIQSAKELKLKTGEEKVFKVGFKNIGQKDWRNSGDHLISLYTVKPNYRLSEFAMASTYTWVSGSQIKMDTELVKPGQIGYFTIHFKAPNKSGKYTESFRLAVEEWTWIKGGDLEIPITVLGEDTQNPPVDSTPDQNFVPVMAEPIIRVGLYVAEEAIVITANGPYEIRDSNNTLVKSLLTNQISTVKFDSVKKVYYLTTVGLDSTLTTYLRFVSTDPTVIFEIKNYEHPPGWDSSLNDNQFRGILEIRYNSSKDRVWVINELPMEIYLKGLAETSSYSPIEYLKTMAVAGRTYAMYHYLKGTKHGDEFFHVDAHYDQVYRGFGLEKRHPMLTQAVDETRGIVVTYNGELAITPYFSQSDGRTRDWSEVWNGEVPWCKSVSDPHNQGRELLGHGVGLSARGALLMDLEDHKTYEEILKYYYTGVDLKKYY